MNEFTLLERISTVGFFIVGALCLILISLCVRLYKKLERDFWYCVKCNKYIKGNIVPDSCQTHLLKRIDSETFYSGGVQK